jgi:phosphatidylserine/phosphatidylglycerophosphate/cardiolipin synthase-like enzyme
VGISYGAPAAAPFFSIQKILLILSKMVPTIPRESSNDQIALYFLTEGEQAGAEVMARLTNFLAPAQRSLDIAAYDMRLEENLRRQLVQVLQERAAAGVRIRICYDGDKPETPNVAAGQDPAPPGTGAFVQGLGFPWRRIGGMKLMHNKFVVRDAAAVWTGSLNLTNDAFALMENNVVTLDSPVLASSYAEVFEQIWEKENFEGTGDLKTSSATLRFAGEPVEARVMFSPGSGLEIDGEIARRVRGAQRRVRLCSLLINSGTLIAALGHLLADGRVKVDGIFDRTQMEQVFRQWQSVPSNQWKIPAVHQIIERAHLVGKNSTPYTPTSRHDFMHNKVLVIDDMVITGSYNFSRSAQFNAENILFLESAALAQRYSIYIDHLLQKYRA